MKTRSRFLGLAGLSVVCALAVGQAQARSDASFMKQAAENGAAEIEASKLAASKATNPEVKAFAEKMVADHTKVAEELKQLAASKKVELPDGPSMKQKAELKLVSGSDGAKFDERYAKSFGVKAHKETIELFEGAAKESKDAEVKAWATHACPAWRSGQNRSACFG